MRIEPEQYRLVGACLTAARRRANLTQTEAAERLGRRQTFISEIERGLRRVDVLEIVLISRALDTDPFQLFTVIKVGPSAAEGAEAEATTEGAMNDLRFFMWLILFALLAALAIR